MRREKNNLKNLVNKITKRFGYGVFNIDIVKEIKNAKSWRKLYDLRTYLHNYIKLLG